MITRHIIALFVFIVCVGSTNSRAGCMELQGVTLCDNGDRQLTIGNSVYTTRDGELEIRDQSGYASDYYILHSRPYYSQCYQNDSTMNNECYRFRRYYGHYYGDLAGQ